MLQGELRDKGASYYNGYCKGFRCFRDDLFRSIDRLSPEQIKGILRDSESLKGYILQFSVDYLRHCEVYGWRGRDDGWR